ncbi:MAG: hypothetical protein AB7E70_10545 [Hyphomicrobiaceae bacterium]
MTDTTVPTHIQLSDQTFWDRFKPIKNHLAPAAPFDDCMLETYGRELDFVQTQSELLVWTVIDCEGEIFIESGARFVNRLGYLIASVPREAHEHFSVGDEPPETVTISRRHLRFVLDYLHESEADHYDPENDPVHAVNHIYRHVLAIETELKEGAL